MGKDGDTRGRDYVWGGEKEFRERQLELGVGNLWDNVET